VTTALGPPANVVGSKAFDRGVVTVWSYERWDAKFGFDAKAEEYYLYFLSDRLEQWGRPGDWAREADRIYEIRVR